MGILFVISSISNKYITVPSQGISNIFDTIVTYSLWVKDILIEETNRNI